jgi:hypothetical protein
VIRPHQQLHRIKLLVARLCCRLQRHSTPTSHWYTYTCRLSWSPAYMILIGEFIVCTPICISLLLLCSCRSDTTWSHTTRKLSHCVKRNLKAFALLGNITTHLRKLCMCHIRMSHVKLLSLKVDHELTNACSNNRCYITVLCTCTATAAQRWTSYQS